MSPDILLDSDVITKLCVYAIEPWSKGRSLAARRISTSASTKFIIPKRISRARINRGKEAARAVWTSFETVAEFLEPSEYELAIAADLELIAQRNGLAFDTGESLLVTMLTERRGRLLVSGDKRAIEALFHLGGLHGSAAGAAGKIACFEQLISACTNKEGGRENAISSLQRANSG